MDAKFTELVEQLNGLDFKGMYGSDFLHTWDKTTDELKALHIVADALRELRENNVSSKIFDSGLAVSLFRDNSTRTRFSFSKAANLRSALSCRTWTRRSPRSLTARPSARPLP